MISPHVGGGFGSKGTPRAARRARGDGGAGRRAAGQARGHAASRCSRSPATAPRRSSACGSAPTRDGRLTAIAPRRRRADLDASREFAEQTAVATRMMYAAPNRRTTHRAGPRSTCRRPSWMRAPGECPGMFALESAMDELAIACGHRPDRAAGPQRARASTRRRGDPFSSRQPGRVPARGRRALRLGGRDPRAGHAARRALARRHRRRRVDLSGPPPAVAGLRRGARPTAASRSRIGAADIGTGARTALTQIAADALGVPRRTRPGRDRRQPRCPRRRVAGGSMGTASWGWAVVKACRALRERLDGARGASRRTGSRRAPTRRRGRRGTTRSSRARVRRAVRRGAGRHRHRRGAGARGCSACSPPAGSSTRGRRARS